MKQQAEGAGVQKSVVLPGLEFGGLLIVDLLTVDLLTADLLIVDRVEDQVEGPFGDPFEDPFEAWEAFLGEEETLALRSQLELPQQIQLQLHSSLVD